jgi:hypothetical protein
MLPNPTTLFLMNAAAEIALLFISMLWMIEQQWPIMQLDPMKQPG